MASVKKPPKILVITKFKVLIEDVSSEERKRKQTFHLDLFSFRISALGPCQRLSYLH